MESKKRRSNVQRMLDSINDMKPNEREELAEALLDAQIDEIPLKEIEGEPITLADEWEEIEKHDKTFGQLVGLSTGYRVLDDMTMGLAPGELTIVAAPTSVGKSLLCLNIAANLVKEDHMVGFITLEMTRPEIGSRLKRILGEADAELVGGVIVNKSDRMSWRSVETFLKKAIEEWKIEVLFIDHLHYFARSMDNQAEELGLITQEFKHLAIKYNIPIVLISHTRKTDNMGKERAATMNDLRGSSFIAQDADIVLMLNRVWMNSEDSGTIVDPTGIRVTLEKNRNRYGVPVGTSFRLNKNGLRIETTLSSEELMAWNRNKPEPKKGFSAQYKPQNSITHTNTPTHVEEKVEQESNIQQDIFSDLI